ncbi:MAG TPA: ester cyclase [Vicinamibacterales bacterium]|nr:ester cyclase [Vicinamibacterales bacterium]
MSTEQNKVAVRRFIDEVFVKGNADGAEKLVTPDFTPHSWGKMPSGVEPLKQAIRRVHAGLSEVRFKIEDMLAEDDKVAVRVTAHAKQQGDFMGIPASGREYTISETHIFHMRDGKVAEHWRDADMLGLMQQLGALPEAKTTKA